MQTKHIIGPNGRRLTVADLPSPDTKRWVIRRKAEVVATVQGGLLSLEQVYSRYALDFEEFQAWQRSINCFGVDGLRTTWTQYYLNFGSPETLIANPKWMRLDCSHHDYRAAVQAKSRVSKAADQEGS